jgi:hypothetical protein
VSYYLCVHHAYAGTPHYTPRMGSAPSTFHNPHIS